MHSINKIHTYILKNMIKITQTNQFLSFFSILITQIITIKHDVPSKPSRISVRVS